MRLPPSRSEKLQILAERLGKAWLDCKQIGIPSHEELPQNRTEAYFVQDQMAKVIGHSLSGWKVGATSARMRELDGHDDVIPGRIFESVTYQGSTHQLPIERFQNARAETEFAFRLLEDIPKKEKPWTSEELESKVVLHPAVELIGNRHLLPDGSKSEKSLMTIADNGGGIGFVFGEEIQNWKTLDFQLHPIQLRIDDSTAAENFFGDMRCIPLKALTDLVHHLQKRGMALHQGDFVSTGAATVPQPFNEGSKVVADFGGIGCIELIFH